MKTKHVISTNKTKLEVIIKEKSLLTIVEKH